jgi:phosphate transport system ATP-binding protein
MTITKKTPQASPQTTMPNGSSSLSQPASPASNGGASGSANGSSDAATLSAGAASQSGMTSVRPEVRSEDSSNRKTPIGPPKLTTKNLDLYYGDKQALKQINTSVPQNAITALIGPSGCGKSTYLRCLNRMNDLIENVRIEGAVELEGQDIYAKNVDVVELRQRVGMVFQRPNPFPMSIYDNICYGPRLHGIKDKKFLNELVEDCLRRSALWDEVKDDLKKSALALSGGQQQRLCIARSLATRPDILLMDEPASALDPISTLKIEELMRELREQFTIVIVTHNMQQAARCSDFTGFFLLGELVEMDVSSKIFTDPSDKRTEDYITGRFG